MRNINDIREAIGIIYRCALMYESNLADKNLIFITDSNDDSAGFEAQFMRHNFKHLTGSATANTDAEVFYNRAIENRLHPDNIILSADGTSSRILRMEIC